MKDKEKVIYDVHKTNSRYMSMEDVRLEARLLGMKPGYTPQDLADELRRRGLTDFDRGRVVAWANA